METTLRRLRRRQSLQPPPTAEDEQKEEEEIKLKKSIEYMGRDAKIESFRKKMWWEGEESPNIDLLRKIIEEKKKLLEDKDPSL